MSNNNLTPEQRRAKAREIRDKATDLAFQRNDPAQQHVGNGDENLDGKLMSFTKGLPHNYSTGLVNDPVDDFQKFVDGICSGDPEVIKLTPLGPIGGVWCSNKGSLIDKTRGWESAGAGLTFDLQGPDAQALTMPPAPELGSDELSAEMAEVYMQAILRDVPFTAFGTDPKVQQCVDVLNELNYFKQGTRFNSGSTLKVSEAFRGFTPGDLVGPYISQFLLTGNNGLPISDVASEFNASDGKINYGAITIDQRVRKATEIDYMTTWDEYFDVQNGADFRGLEQYDGNERRFITTGRDLATYVHYDALYEAYLNACLILLGMGAPFDEGVPFQGADTNDKQQGFAQFGGPHILTLVTEVATRALKAVRYQKFNIHRRLRPEALAARLHRRGAIATAFPGSDASNRLNNLFLDLEQAGILELLEPNNLLLPMAFCEGSPMHPSYGAGHATVAGACVTILKAFFNHKVYLTATPNGSRFQWSNTAPDKTYAFIPTANGQSLGTAHFSSMTLEGELNKLAANISIGRDWAGVHYYSDYRDSMILGEEIAIGLLEEQALTYNPAENFSMTVPKFDGTEITISNPNPAHV